MLIEIIQPYAHILIWLSVASVAAMLLGILSLPWLVGFIPVDFLSESYDQPQQKRKISWPIVILKNLVGFVLLLTGLLLLVLPGQGLLTILVGLLFMDYPGKQKLEVRLLGNPRILETINWLRAKRGKPPIEPPM